MSLKENTILMGLPSVPWNGLGTMSSQVSIPLTAKKNKLQIIPSVPGESVTCSGAGKQDIFPRLMVKSDQKHTKKDSHWTKC